MEKGGIFPHNLDPLSLGHWCGLQIKGLTQGDLVLREFIFIPLGGRGAPHEEGPHRDFYEAHTDGVDHFLGHRGPELGWFLSRFRFRSFLGRGLPKDLSNVAHQILKGRGVGASIPTQKINGLPGLELQGR